MSEVLTAIFEHGVFRPLTVSNIVLDEGQRVRLIVEPVASPDEVMTLATRVYDGLSAEEVDEIERLVLDRRDLFSDRTAE